MTFKIEIKGLEEVKKFLKNASKEKIEKADNGVKQAGFFIQSEVQASISHQRAEPLSVDTGRFLGSVKAMFPQKLVATVETNVEYAKFLERGTKNIDGTTKMEARHHFRNSADRNKIKVKEFIANSIK